MLLFGGPYSNAQATLALMDAARARGIPAGQIICTGDVVAYAGDPVQTVALVRALGCTVVAGNCELQLASGALDCGCGFEEGSTCDLLSVNWFNHASQAIDQDDKVWMCSLPDVVSFTHGGARYGVLHGGVTDVARFIWRSSEDAVFAQEWQVLEESIGQVDRIIAGHCGIPFVKDTSRGQWINAGVVGMPPHDGRQKTRYATLADGRIALHALDYDAKKAAARMHDVGLPPDYARSLISGYWPSEDVLPADLRVPSLASG